jgi:hypothetical protein
VLDPRLIGIGVQPVEVQLAMERMNVWLPSACPITTCAAGTPPPLSSAVNIDGAVQAIESRPLIWAPLLVVRFTIISS